MQNFDSKRINDDFAWVVLLWIPPQGFATIVHNN
jgi:hypothetical protein